jgi:hypothetical protein
VYAPQRAVMAVGAVLAVTVLPLAGRPAQAAGGRATAGGRLAWRLVAAHHYGASANQSGYSAVVSPGRGDAWVFGGTNPGGPSSATAEHWNGKRWRAVSLPRGLGGFITAASASAAKDIWAVSYSGSYVLHWNGRHWTVAKRWRHPAAAASITAVGPSDVWVFGGSGTAWHFNGRHWARAGRAAGRIYRASPLAAGDIWAISNGSRGRYLERYNGRAWRSMRTPPVLAGVRLTDILAVTRRNVWVCGISSAHLVAAHWNGARWTRFAAPWRLLPERFATDGRGGIWIPTAAAPLTRTSWLLHLSAGHWTRTKITVGLGSGVGDLARIPGTGSLWGSGGFLTRTGGDAAIWAHGRVPARAIRSAATRTAGRHRLPGHRTAGSRAGAGARPD